MVPRYRMFIEPGRVRYDLVHVKVSLKGGLLSDSRHALSSGHSLCPLIRRWLLELQKAEELNVWRLRSCIRLSEWKFLC